MPPVAAPAASAAARPRPSDPCPMRLRLAPRARRLRARRAGELRARAGARRASSPTASRSTCPTGTCSTCPAAASLPNAGVLPYDLVTPLFSDYAHKLRTVWMPAGQSAKYTRRQGVRVSGRHDPVQDLLLPARRRRLRCRPQDLRRRTGLARRGPGSFARAPGRDSPARAPRRRLDGAALRVERRPERGRAAAHRRREGRSSWSTRRATARSSPTSCPTRTSAPRATSPT